MTQIDDYYEYVYHTPWGRMFYRLLWDELEQVLKPKMRILDFGSGFGVTSQYLGSRGFDVTAYEPNLEMVHKDKIVPNYLQLTGTTMDMEAQLRDQHFDFILVHNVLEYAADPQGILNMLKPLLKPTGQFSIVKHNRLGHVFTTAVLFDDPKRALAEYDKAPLSTETFGNLQLYNLDDLKQWTGRTFVKDWGLRVLYGLSSDNDIKYTADWQEGMFFLEKQLSEDPAAKQTAYFEHVITSSKPELQS